ncbi:MAG: hypothetical protein ACP5H5_06725 [Pyrobaculum sp.]
MLVKHIRFSEYKGRVTAFGTDFLICGVLGALEGGRFVATCAFSVDVYFVAVYDGEGVFRAVDLWSGVGRPRPLPMPPDWRESYATLELEKIYREYRRGVGRVSLEVVREPEGYLKVGGRPAWHHVLGVLPDGRWVYLDEEFRTYVGEFKPAVEDPLSTYGAVGRLEAEGEEVDVRQVEGPFGAPGLRAAPERCDGPRGVVCNRFGEKWVDWEMWRDLLDWPLSDPVLTALRRNRVGRGAVVKRGGFYHVARRGAGFGYVGNIDGGRPYLKQLDGEIELYNRHGFYAFVKRADATWHGWISALGVSIDTKCAFIGRRGPYLVAICCQGGSGGIPYPIFKPCILLEGIQLGHGVYFTDFFWDFKNLKPHLNPPLRVWGSLSRWYVMFSPLMPEEVEDLLAGMYEHKVVVFRGIPRLYEAYLVLYPFAFAVPAQPPCNIYTCDFSPKKARSEFVLEVVREPEGYLKVGGRPAWHHVLGVLPDGRWVYLDEEFRTYVGEFKPAVEDPLSTYGVVGTVELRPFHPDEFYHEIWNVEAPMGAPSLIACSRDLEEASRRTYERYGVGYNLSGCADGVVWPCRIEDHALWRALLDWPLADPKPHVIRIIKNQPSEVYPCLSSCLSSSAGDFFDYVIEWRKLRGDYTW